MQNLNPTLWRTCRMLSGEARIRLLRTLHDQPGRNVTELAQAVDIGLSDASQELRRIQSRGLLQPEHRGAALVYRLGADPQVASAAPLLKALKATFASPATDSATTIQAIANSFGHPKRIAILKSLMQAPKSVYGLHNEIRTAYGNLQRHLQILLDSGLVCRKDRQLHFIAPIHPLARALLKLLPE